MRKLSGLARALNAIHVFTSLDYTIVERIRLFLTRLKPGREARVLNYRVRYLDRASFQLLLSEVFFKQEYAFKTESRAPVILDCGSNIGLATLFFKRMFPNARIHAFEPDPDTFSVLNHNIAQNCLRDVSAHNVLLADVDGESSFYVCNEVPGSLMMSRFSDRLQTSREIRVKAVRLSNYIEEPVDLLKLDVEGAEFDILRELLSSGKLALIRRMVIEYHHKIADRPAEMSEFLALLEEAGFEYQIAANCDPVLSENKYQDILVGAYRRST